MNQSQIENIFTEIVSVVYNGLNTNPQPIELKVPFVCDKVEVSCSIAPNGVGDITPLYSNGAVGDIYQINANLIAVTSTLGIETGTLCICNIANTYNPISVYLNTNRRNIGGSYMINVFNTSSNVAEPLETGVLTLFFTFTRYSTR